jgi:hypothetical protein
MSKLFRDLAYACIVGHLLGRAIGLLIRWHSDRRVATQRVGAPPMRRNPGHNLDSWSGKFPNSIG